MVTDPLVADQPLLETSISNHNFVANYERRDPAVTGVDVYASWATSLTNELRRVNGDGLIETSEGWNHGVETRSVLLSLDHTNGFIRIEAVMSPSL